MSSPVRAVEKKRAFSVVGHDERKVDGIPLVTGRPKFVADIDLPDTLYVKMRIVRIDTSKAEAIPGVALVLTHENTPTRRFTTAGQGYPEPSPYDTRMFDTKVRFVGTPSRPRTIRGCSTRR